MVTANKEEESAPESDGEVDSDPGSEYWNVADLPFGYYYHPDRGLYYGPPLPPWEHILLESSDEGISHINDRSLSHVHKTDNIIIMLSFTPRVLHRRVTITQCKIIIFMYTYHVIFGF